MAILREKQFGDVTLNIGGGSAQTDDEHSRRGNEGDREIQLGGTEIADLLANDTTPSSELDEAEVAETPAKAIVVNSCFTALYSPVFRAMLRTNFAESSVNNSPGNWVVNLPDDDVEPLFFLLSMTHGRWENIPKKISIDELHDLLITADKYDMMRIFLPWYLDWTASYRFPWWNSWEWSIMTLPYVDLLLWLAWENQLREHCETIIFRMSYWYRVNDKGELLGLDGLPLQLRGTWNTDGIMSLGSAPMLRVHTGNLADLIGIVKDVGYQIYRVPHCSNVQCDVYSTGKVTEKVERYMRSLLTLA
ncbi:nuclear pore protein-like protein [Colletotrichum kahawae]|uniref:Nuclear pore protein-like protein n=1 Tax=Colletotrichum kahawae TaxID=34407 RepID=A0AAE0DB22_COLKA|nr:nuclear pore protein-like protein [Colletotrichum kahawae]